MEPAAATQPIEPESQPAPAETLFPARLAVVRTKAKLRRGGAELEVQQAQAADVQVDDEIEVVGQEGQAEQSYSILHFPDFLNLELFSNTSIVLRDVRQGDGGSTDVTLQLKRGQIFVHVNEQSITQVTVETPFRTIKTLMAGTEFDVCHNEQLTCVLVKRGAVEVSAQGRKEIVRAGSAGFVLNEQPPSPPVCAPAAAFSAWEENFRRSASAPALEDEIARLPQQPCPVTAAGLPLDARILYLDHFTDLSGGWEQGETPDSSFGYSERTFYRVQIKSPEVQYLAFIPGEPDYDDVNIDTRAFIGTGAGGDFRFGLVFRRTGERYYAFVVSPPTNAWYFLKGTPDGVQTLKQGTDGGALDLAAEDWLRIEVDGPNFLLFINGRFIDWVRDFDYTRGEVGLFVETLDSDEALIHFNSLIVWEMPPALLIPNTGGREYCFNGSDDDGDGWIDSADPDCQRPEIALILTSLPPLQQPTNTLLPTHTPEPADTLTPRPTNTRPPTRTPTLRPTNTRRPTITPTLRPTSTRRPTVTSTLRPTSTRRPTATLTPRPTNTRPPALTSTPRPTSTQRPTLTPMPRPTSTRQPTLTSAPQPTNTRPPTNTPVPEPTNTRPPTNTPQPEPTATERPEPTATERPEPTATERPEPTATERPEPTATERPEPTATEAPLPTEPPEPTAAEEPTATEAPTTPSIRKLAGLRPIRRLD
ncbi:MAG TPA: FecR domain-containing protein [Anaerolineales bacterium]|nr:FecR domain-containing protein [Anaerolineales bacterium]